MTAATEIKNAAWGFPRQKKTKRLAGKEDGSEIRHVSRNDKLQVGYRCV